MQHDGSIICNMDFYVYTSSGRSNLVRDLYLDGEWEVALTEIHVSSTERLLFVIGDFVDTSLVGNTSLQILRKVHDFDIEFHHPYYIPVTLRYISAFTITLLTENLQETGAQADIVLHFRRRLIRLC